MKESSSLCYRWAEARLFLRFFWRSKGKRFWRPFWSWLPWRRRSRGLWRNWNRTCSEPRSLVCRVYSCDSHLQNRMLVRESVSGLDPSRPETAAPSQPPFWILWSALLQPDVLTSAATNPTALLDKSCSLWVCVEHFLPRERV